MTVGEHSLQAHSFFGRTAGVRVRFPGRAQENN
jgi:hypothetical protein